MYQSKWAPPPPSPSAALSPAAPSFSPAPIAPPPDISTVDAFAPTGAVQDDLFDEIVPLDASTRVRSEDDLFQDGFTPVAQPVVEQQPLPPTQPRGRGDGVRGRGRARGRGAGVPARRGAPANGQSPQSLPPQQQQNGEPTPSTAPENAPAGPFKPSAPASVRGNRRGTGGVTKPKLTETELAEKMAAIQIKNASLTAAHARAEADAASFAEHEEAAKVAASQKQKAERRDRQQMMGERERNRERKLKAMEGREWDAEKNDQDFGRGGRFDKKGGFAGDQGDYDDGREYLYREPRGGGRGGRERGRGGGDRGGEKQAPPKQEEFPALPDAAAKKDTSAALPTFTTDGPLEKSWADQVEDKMGDPT